MSRSRKKEPVIKDRGFKKNEYNKKHRRACKQVYVDENTVFPESQELTNDYDVCDFKYDARYWGDEEEIKKYKRK